MSAEPTNPTAARPISLPALAEQVAEWCESMRVTDAGSPYGSYRFTRGGEADFYASCDAAILRWAIGEDVRSTVSAAHRAEWAGAINAHQRPEDGRFGPFMGHHPLHANGTAVNALCILGERLRHPVAFYDLFGTPERIGPWLSQIDWKHAWPASHLVWGGPATWIHSRRAGKEWEDACFAWLDAQLDPDTGGWPREFRHPGWRTIEPLGCAVHVWPLYRHTGRPVPGLAALTARVLEWQRPDGTWDGNVGFYGSMDALYVLAVALEQGLPEPDRYRAAVDRYLEPLLAAGPHTWADTGPDMHRALCWVSSIGYAQRARPELFGTGSGPAGWGDIFDRPEIYDLDAVLPAADTSGTEAAAAARRREPES